MRVLFCTDGSKISFSALRNFANWAENTTVDVICVIDWSFLPDEASVEEPAFMTSCANIADNILEYAKNEINNTGLHPGEEIKQCGPAVETILEQISKKNYDIILLGSNGKKGIQKWLGSVSREIISGTDNTVYVSKNPNKHEKILFTTDGSEIAVRALQKTLEYFDLTGKEIYICMVNENPDLLFLEGTLDTNWLMSIERRQEIYAAEAIKKMRKIIEAKHCTIANDAIITGIPAQKIIDFSLKENIDLIVLGNKNKSKMSDFLLGSVSMRVLENAASDILLIRE